MRCGKFSQSVRSKQIGKVHPDAGSLSSSALNLDRPPMQIRTVFDEGQTQAGTGHVSNVASAIERLQHMGNIRIRNSDAVVTNQKLDSAARCRPHLSLHR